ncbi:MAG: hypothetical protein ACKVXR_07770 [Planctomycetota bacterium]
METEQPKNEAPKSPATEADAGQGRKSKALFLALGLSFVAGTLLAVLAMPGKAEHPPVLEGPFVALLSSESVQVNLAGENGKRYLVLGLNAEFFAYSEHYVAARLGTGGAAAGGHGGEAAAPDPLYTAMLKDTLLRLAGRRTREQVEDPVQMEAFLMELRAAVEPLLFPLCIGDSTSPQIADTKSGLRVGESAMDSTYRGLLHEHALHVDAPRKTLRLDDGPETPFQGQERDLRVNASDGTTAYVNVSLLDPKFVGDVPLGVAGRVRRIYRQEVLVQ